MMRYCPECHKVYKTNGNVCGACNCKTETLEVSDDQMELFERTDVDRRKSVLDDLLGRYEEAVDDVTKAERKLRASIAAKDAAQNTLINFCKLEGIISSNEEPVDPEDDEEPAADLMPELPANIAPDDDDAADATEFAVWTEDITDTDDSTDVPNLPVEDDDEIRPIGDGLYG